MRILHVLDHSIPLQSGYTFRTRAILEQQRSFGWETFHITGAKQGKGSGQVEEDVDGLHFYRSPPLEGLAARLPMYNQWAVVHGLRKRLDEVVRKLKPDILHAHSPALNGLAALSVARRHGIPLVYEVRAFWEDAAVDHGTSREGGLRYRLTRALETHVLKGADAVTTICEGLRGDIIDRGLPEDKVTVIPNSVALERFPLLKGKDESLLVELGLQGSRVVGFIGSFYAYEGLPLLLEALPLILSQRDDVRLLLVGGGPQEKALRQLTEQLGLGNKVIFTGRVSHNEVQRYYSLVDIFVYPRLSMRLTELVTPLKPLEAMAQGRLVVASDVGGHKELIEAGVTGELFPAGDAAGLANAVLRLLDDESRWPQRLAAGRDYVERVRNWRASAERYQPLYAALTGN
ncbi:MAG TPA: TIGR04063 family PEP-CTERM/XrtA system glycosyltransferase [Gammaproteobacteria bacterium]|nr:TIGR04063 family PEP-CTERM/XrtA system glycosyltransferase [Gammaproteobacteria bacterium]